MIKLPEKALLRNEIVFLQKAVKHYASQKEIVIFADANGEKQFASIDEWLKGSNELERQHEVYDGRSALAEIKTAEILDISTNKNYPAAEEAFSFQVDMRSSVSEKIKLYRSLFKGRTDVYAHGYRRNDGGISYVFTCQNEWKRGVCPKCSNPRTSCSKCGKKSYKPLTDDVMYAHLVGKDDRFRDVVGMYVIDEQGSVSVLVADFDKTGWQDEVRAYCSVAETFGVAPSVEISRSGNGAHVWIFFSVPIEAKTARNLGTAFITKAMENTGKLTFDAYDRLFPAQDYVSEGGLGSLISLPLQGKARRLG